jgi:probable F420-dependent oxidoreductase
MSPVSHLTFGTSLGSFAAGLPVGSTLLAWAAEIEQLGFDALWFRDHVLWHSPVLDPFTMLGAIAGRTSRLRLSPGVLLLPLRNPLLVAKAVASLDFVSGGRAMLGVGVGGEFPQEYEACGVPMRERGRRADEGLDAIRALWTRSPAAHEGSVYRFADVVMEPRPVQRPHPPIWVGGRSDQALERAGRRGDGWLAYFTTPQGFRKRLDRALDQWARRQPRRDSFGAGLVVYIHVARSREDAERAAVEYLTREYRQPFDELAGRYCALGRPDQCAADLARFAEAGVREFVLIPTCPPAMFMDQLRAVAADVIPCLSGAADARGTRALAADDRARGVPAARPGA